LIKKQGSVGGSYATDGPFDTLFPPFPEKTKKVLAFSVELAYNKSKCPDGMSDFFPEAFQL